MQSDALMWENTAMFVSNRTVRNKSGESFCANADEARQKWTINPQKCQDVIEVLEKCQDVIEVL